MHINYSIIIPHYNDFERLERLLQSIPLERKNIQTIVIDDCSHKQKKLNLLKEKYPIILWLSTGKNSGAGRARNIGMDSAIGKFLLFADSDDEFMENAFEILDHISSEQIGDLCYFLAEAVQEDDFSASNRATTYNQLCINYLKKQNTSSLSNLKMRHVVPWAKIYRRDSIESFGLRFDEIPSSNDVAFNVLAACKLKQINVIPFFIYRVYRRSGSLTSNISKDDLLKRLNVIADLRQRLKYESISERPLATSFLVRSMRYGPFFFLRVLYKIIRSGLALFTAQQFYPQNIYESIRKTIQTKKERSKMSK